MGQSSYPPDLSDRPEREVGQVSLPDGADATQGAKADAAWNGTDAAATEIAILKAIYGLDGGAVTVADGADVALGTTTDDPWDASILTNPGTAIAILKRVVDRLINNGYSLGDMDVTLGTPEDPEAAGDGGVVALLKRLRTLLNAGLPAALGSGGGLKVDGSGTALPISAASLPLPTGAATAANQPSLGTAGTASADVLSVQGRSGMTPLVVNGSGVTQPVSGTFWQATQPVSAAALPLPSGAATEATAATLLAEGTNITGASMPAGGAHGMGWLSAIWKLLAGGLPAALGANGGLKMEGIAGGVAVPTSTADGGNVAIGTTGDAATATTVIGRLQKLVALLPTALGANGGLKVEGIAGGVAVPTSTADGGNIAIGNTGDAATATTVIGRLQKLVALLPTALGANGGLKVEGIAGGVALPVSVALLPAALGTGTLAQSLTTNSTSAALYDGTATGTGSGAALAGAQAVRSVVVQADPANTTNVLIGNSSSQHFVLRPGDTLPLLVADLATVYIKAVSGSPVVNYLGRS